MRTQRRTAAPIRRRWPWRRRWWLLAFAALILLPKSGIAAVPALVLSCALLLAVANEQLKIASFRHSRNPARPAPPPAPPGAPPPPPPPTLAASQLELREIATTRIGEPVDALCPCVITLEHGQTNTWEGSTPMWIALGERNVALLHTTPGGGIGGVNTLLTRTGAHTRTVPVHQDEDLLEISWPLRPWFITVLVHGTASERHQLLALLAADQLGLRNPAH